MGEFTIEDIESVTVNGMGMWKLGNNLFLTRADAISEVEKLKYNWRALAVSYNPNVDVMGIICKDGSIKCCKF